MEYDGRISLILPNTEKGNSVLQASANEMNLFRLPLEDALNPTQGNLLHPSIPHKERRLFEELYPTYGFVRTLQKTELGKNIIRKNQKIRLRQTVFYKALRRVYHIFK